MDKGDQRTSSSATDQSQTKTAASFHAKRTAAVIGEAPSTSVKSVCSNGRVSLKRAPETEQLSGEASSTHRLAATGP